jgi:hypothetical protein
MEKVKGCRSEFERDLGSPQSLTENWRSEEDCCYCSRKQKEKSGLNDINCQRNSLNGQLKAQRGWQLRWTFFPEPMQPR